MNAGDTIGFTIEWKNADGTLERLPDLADAEALVVDKNRGSVVAKFSLTEKEGWGAMDAEDAYRLRIVVEADVTRLHPGATLLGEFRFRQARETEEEGTWDTIATAELGRLAANHFT